MDDQDNARQREELIRYGVDGLDIWEDKASGRNMDRPGWQGLWKDIRDGDVVVILSLDRLGRDVLQMLQTVEAMKVRGVELRVIQGGLTTATAAGRFAFNILASVAQFEREMINERTMHGLKMARERGVVGGRPTKMNPERVAEALRRIAAGESHRAIAEGWGVAVATVTRAVERHRKQARIKGREGS